MAFSDLLLSDARHMLNPLPSIAERSQQCLDVFVECARDHQALGVSPHVFNDRIESLAAWRTFMGVDRLEQKLACHPRALLIIHAILDKLCIQLDAVTTKAMYVQRQGARPGRTETCKNKRRGDRSDHNLVMKTTDELMIQIEDSVKCLNRIGSELAIFCQTVKAHELSNLSRSTRAKTRSIIGRVRAATEQHIDQKLPKVSRSLYSALVAANARRIEYLLCTKAARSLSNDESTLLRARQLGTYLEPLMCVSDLCCDRPDDEVLTFASTEDWIAHMSSAVHRPRWACSRGHDDDVKPVFDDVEAFKRHMRMTHGTKEENMECRVEMAWFAGARVTTVERLITDCMFCDEFAADNEGGPSCVFVNAALETHVREHLLGVADVLWREAGDVLLGLGADDQVPTYEDDIKATAPTDYINRRDRNILHYACLHGSTELLSALIHGCDVIYPLIRQPDAKGQTALHYAARHNLVAGIRVLMEESGEPTRYSSRNGRDGPDAYKPPLTAAQRAERLRLLQMRDGNGFSPFLVAVMHGHYAAARAMLVDFNVPVDAVDEHFGASALIWAASRGDVYLTELLLQHRADVMLSASNGLVPLHEAAARGHDAVVRILLRENDADVDRRSSRGLTALHLAAGAGHLATVKLLLQHKASANAASIDGVSPLHCAANAGVDANRAGATLGDHVAIVELLLRHNACATAATTDGVSPLHCAANAGHPQIVSRLLLESAAPTLMEATTYRWTPLHFAATAGHTRIVEQLLAANPTVDLYDANGCISRTRVSHPHATPFLLPQAPMTPLQVAAAANNVSLATFLLASTSAVNETTFTRQTAFYYAARAGHTDMVALLLSAPHNADIHILPPGVPSWKRVVASDTAIFNLIRKVGPIGSNAGLRTSHNRAWKRKGSLRSELVGNTRKLGMNFV
ncbi:uncharacterized protein LMH87_007648 [Akanthomyces muscarius]|uniref:Ankyrin repeat protein n=1 Tax=Akanthomyces muscarius TaxID=2231603 RepID=A0A9W8UNN7_AKAMU|nr:uncharacterized protein LMH87_007648 [Akanthomyces muscarius]KAJ4161618.1 hypothetical protein LMH87_007648 [Akanthomyces muscarius]